MKKIYLLTVLVSINIIGLKAQTVFSDAFLGEGAIDCFIYNDEIYVNLISDDSIYKLSLDNPDDPPVLVADNDFGNFWTLSFNSENNTIYGGYLERQVTSTILSGSLPVTAELYYEFPPTFGPVFGVATMNEKVFYCTTEYSGGVPTLDQIYVSDTTIGGSSSEIFYQAEFKDMAIMTVYGDYLYFARGTATEIRDAVFRKNINDSSAEAELVIESLPGRIQALYAVNDLLYIGLEVTGNNSIHRIDLNTSDFPTTSVAFATDVPPVPSGISSRGDQLFVIISGGRILTWTDPLLNTNDLVLENLSLYPNPVANRLKLGSTASGSIREFKIFDLGGRQIKQGEVFPVTGLEVSDLKSGVYFLQVSAEKQQQTIKFIKL